MTGTAGEQEPDGNAAEAEPDRRLLELLVCPQTKSRLIYKRDTRELLSPKAGVAYPILNGVPILTGDAARPLRDDEYPRGD